MTGEHMGLDYRSALANYMRLDAEERRVRKALESLTANLNQIETQKDMAFSSYSRALQAEGPPQVQAVTPKATHKNTRVAPDLAAYQAEAEAELEDGPMPADALHAFSEAAESDIQE